MLHASDQTLPVTMEECTEAVNLFYENPMAITILNWGTTCGLQCRLSVEALLITWMVDNHIFKDKIFATDWFKKFQCTCASSTCPIKQQSEEEEVFIRHVGYPYSCAARDSSHTSTAAVCCRPAGKQGFFIPGNRLQYYSTKDVDLLNNHTIIIPGNQHPSVHTV